ncbi:MD-2-related lipid-recognition protein-like [Phymastichus coffea]|uniref:MD-2-related lipid-recognition protein-like n=1 Tax=Phymastichus coffea TaxID=108790 RepID=UPI00273BC4F2|nr:MD-2-related lipid-recognition protein-like [Phymastichus coffea]
MTSSWIGLLILAACLDLAVHAEVVPFKACPETKTNFCTINEIRVDPCKEAAQGKACVLKKGEDATISYDFTPKFESKNLESRAFWSNQLIDLPFMGMETNACKEGTTCPLKKDAQNTYKIKLPILKEYPARPFDVKFKLWNTDKDEENCCFMIQVKLVK